MPTPRDRHNPTVLRIDGEDPIRLTVDSPETVELPVVHDTRGFECASGAWIERDWTGIPVFELLDAAEIPDETTHVQFESVDDYRSCVALSELEDALVAIGDGDGLPRLVGPQIVGPRAIKTLSRVRPLALPPDESREQHERLPIDKGS